MVEELQRNLFRITVPLPNNPLRFTNSYFLRGDSYDLLIDTGFRCSQCQEALEEGLKELGSVPERRCVLLTHYHSDHSGLADTVVGNGQKIYMHEADIDILRQYLEGGVDKRQAQRYLSEGFPSDLIATFYSSSQGHSMRMKQIPAALTPLKDGDVLHVGEFHLKTIWVPGHTPGSCMFWLAEQKILFTGDHVLFDISPHLSVWPTEQIILGDYLSSLVNVKEYPVALALPGHRKSGDYRNRVQELMEHHQVRLDEIMSIIEAFPGITGYDLTGKMQWHVHASSWETFPIGQRYFAVGECLAHLDYLVFVRKAVRRKEDNLWRYYPA